MLIYRIERDGLGPYSNSGEIGEIPMGRAGDYEHPGTVPDGCGYLRMDIDYCGFDSPHQLFAWFHLERNADFWRWAVKHGFELVTYDVDRKFVRFGNKQVVFIKKQARKVHQIPIKEIWS